MSNRIVHCKRDPYDVYIGRPSKWGNPFTIGVHGSREEVIAKYRVLVQREMESGRFAIASVPPLRGGDFEGMGKSIEVEEEGEDGG